MPKNEIKTKFSIETRSWLDWERKFDPYHDKRYIRASHVHDNKLYFEDEIYYMIIKRAASKKHDLRE